MLTLAGLLLGALLAWIVTPLVRRAVDRLLP